MAKLCALVSMQRIEGPTVQSFSLPMTLVDKGMQVCVCVSRTTLCCATFCFPTPMHLKHPYCNGGGGGGGGGGVGKQDKDRCSKTE